MPLTAGVTVIGDADARCVHGGFVGVITATKKVTSHVEQWQAQENTGHVPTADLVGNIVTAGVESWRPCNTKWATVEVGRGRQCWLA